MQHILSLWLNVIKELAYGYYILQTSSLLLSFQAFGNMGISEWLTLVVLHCI